MRMVSMMTRRSRRRKGRAHWRLAGATSMHAWCSGVQPSVSFSSSLALLCRRTFRMSGCPVRTARCRAVSFPCSSSTSWPASSRSPTLPGSPEATALCSGGMSSVERAVPSLLRGEIRTLATLAVEWPVETSADTSADTTSGRHLGRRATRQRLPELPHLFAPPGPPGPREEGFASSFEHAAVPDDRCRLGFPLPKRFFKEVESFLNDDASLSVTPPRALSCCSRRHHPAPAFR